MAFGARTAAVKRTPWRVRRNALKAVTECRLKKQPSCPVWRQKDRNGEPLRFRLAELPADDF
jgi:hypothetical protein